MRDTSLLQLALGLVPRWGGHRSEFDAEARQLNIHIDFAAGSQFGCPTCGADDCLAYDSEQMSWRYLTFSSIRRFCTPACRAYIAPAAGSRRSTSPGHGRTAASPCCSRR
jgi:hypothetical protein